MSFSSKTISELDCPVCAVDRCGTVREVNYAFASLAGATAVACAGLSLREWLPARDAETLIEQLRDSNAGRCALTSTFGSDHAARRPVAASILSAANGGDAVAIISIVPLAAGGAIQESAVHVLREMEAVMQNAPVGVLFTRDQRIVRYNERFRELFGFDGDSALDRPLRCLYGADEDHEALTRAAAPLLSQGKPYQQELTMRRQDGTDISVNLFAHVQNPEDTGEGTIWIIEDRTGFKQAEDAFQRTLLELRAIIDNASVGILFTRDRVIQRCNRRLAEIFGYPAPEDLIGKPGVTLHQSTERYEEVSRLLTPLLRTGESFHDDWQGRRADGTPIWTEVYGRAVDLAHTDQGTVWILEDIDQAKRNEVALQKTLREMEAIMKNASVGVAFTRERRLTRANPKFYEMFGYNTGEADGLAARALYRSEEDYQLVGRAAVPLLSQGKPFQMELWMRRKDGTEFWANLIGYVLNAEDTNEGTIWICEDRSEYKRAQDALRDELEARVRERTANLESEIAQRERAELRLKYLALHDSLTGLPNRALLRQHIVSAVGQAVALDRLGAVLFVDIDRFKNVNDTLGHHIGDMLLREVASRISGAVRTEDVVARIGGDEFVVVASAVETAEDAHKIAQKILANLQTAIQVKGHELFATPSIGIALFPRDGHDADELLRNADTAMYEAKSAGRNAIRFFELAMMQVTEQYIRTESSLRRALEHGEFEPYYHPVIGLRNGTLEQLELLARWRHPELGVVEPAEFIAVAEEAGLVGALGLSVLRAACRQLRVWDQRGLAVPKLAINLSALQFRDRHLLEQLSTLLAEERIAPTRIELEITETALMRGGEQTLATLRALADRGFSLAIDDFGTGYSSFSYLKRFPVHRLKIDRSFIRDMTQDSDDEAIVQTIVTMARTLRLATTAEGVETASQHDALRRFGCDLAQGFLFARPLPAAQLEAFVFGRAWPTVA